MASKSDTQTPVIAGAKTELRRCVMNEWASYNGLGLILKSNRVDGQPTNLIRQVELGSPAHYAGVLPNDFIIKVNNRYVEFEKFDHVFKLIRDSLKRDKRIELLLINADYIDQFRQKFSRAKKLDFSSHTVSALVKNYQSPLYNPNTAQQASSSADNQPRLCHLLTWPNYDGYGFYVAYTNSGCFVKNVEPNSPAQLGGLRDYDRIVEIAGKPINNASDRNMVMKLVTKRKMINGSTVRSKSSYLSSRSSNSLDNSYLDVFVCDPNTYKYLKERRVELSSKNKSLRMRECFTPREFELADGLSVGGKADSVASDPALGHVVVKRCLVRRVRGRGDEPLGFEMTKRGNYPNFISRVEADSTAELSGLRQDDFILELNEKNVQNDDNSLLKDKIFKHLDTDGQFLLTTINRQGFEHCTERAIDPLDFVRSHDHLVQVCHTPSDTGHVIKELGEKTPRLCVIEKKSDSDELGLSIARYKNIDEHIVSDVSEGSLAHRAGIKQNDCLIEVNGVNVQQMSHADTINLIAGLKRQPNAKINFLVVENGLAKKSEPSESRAIDEDATDTDQMRTNTASLSSAKPSINVYPEIKVCEFVGYEPKTQLGLVITSDDYSHDVVKVNDDSPAQRAGLCKGDVILAVNGQSVENKPNAIELLNEFSETKPLKVLAASRYAYEWSKLLKIKITEKDWPNIKKFVTRNLAAQSRQNQATSAHNLHQEDKNFDDTQITNKHYKTINAPTHSNMHHADKYLDDTKLTNKHYQTINASMHSNMHLEDKHFDDIQITNKHYQTINASVRSNLGRSAVDITADGKVLRLCSLVLDPTSANPTDSEFGFDLVTKISGNRRIGDYLIDTVDLYSPACCSGLKPGDRLVEVDGVDVSTKTFEQVVQLINDAKQRCKLKLLVYPGMVINYANQSIIPELREEHVISNEHFNQTYTSVESARSLPDLSDHYSKNFNGRKHESVQKSSDALNILRPVPRLCTIYKQSESNIGFGVQVNKTSQIVPNYVRVNIVNYKSPAYMSGLQAGDLIVEINGHNTLSMSWDEALHYVKTSYEVNNYVKLLVASEFCYNWLKDNQLLATMNSDNANTFSYADYLKSHHRYVPRLCRVRLFPFSKSFGFSIESMLIRPINGSQATSYAHIINRVDKESPAYASSIQKGDRIVEFDGVNVESENQQQLLDRIYQAFVNVKQICLLVVDPDTDNYFKSKCVKLHGMLPIVQHITNSTEI